jgi:hypothetical protein
MNLMTKLIAVMLNINTCQQTQDKSLLPWTSQTSYFLVSHCGHILHQECSHLHKIKKKICQETEEQFEHSSNGKNQGLVSQMNKHHSLTASSSKHAHGAILCTATYLRSRREITTATIKGNTTVRTGVTQVCFPCMGYTSGAILLASAVKRWIFWLVSASSRFTFEPESPLV